MFTFLMLQELYEQLQDLPTTEQVLSILAMTPDQLEQTQTPLAKNILIWYVDRWLPIVIGSEYWDENNRHYKLPTDKCKITMRDGTEEERVLCTISSEAFGLLVYDNCRDKWANIMKLKAQNPGKIQNFWANVPRSSKTYTFSFHPFAQEL